MSKVNKRIRIVRSLGMYNFRAGVELEVVLIGLNNVESVEVVIGDINAGYIRVQDIDPAFYEVVRYKPRRGETYYYFTDTGEVVLATWSNNLTDFRRYRFGNVSDTLADANEKIPIISEALKND